MVRKASYEDIPRMMKLFEAAKAIMRSDGNMTQWADGYPTVARVTEDIDGGNSYVILDSDGNVAGTFAFIIGPDPTYRTISGGRWLDDSATYGTIHRLASEPSSHGIARECFDYCWSIIRNLRIDTHSDNRIMRHCIEKGGFIYCGEIHLADGAPRLAYQKI